MKRAMPILSVALMMSVPVVAAADDGDEQDQTLSGTRATSTTAVMSSQMTAWLQGGYHAEVSIQPRRGRLEMGVVVSGTDVDGVAKDIVFDIKR